MGKAVVLLSGGIDSATALGLALSQGFEVTALTFRYGQRHWAEVAAAERIARASGIADHVIMEIDLRTFGGSSLTDDIEVPKGRSLQEMCAAIPDTYVPARNSIFLTYAIALAEVRCAADIFVGINALDYSGYPDCRPEYIAAFEAMANLATKAAIDGQRLQINAPLMHKSKAEIIRMGLELGIDYTLTSSCYAPTGAGLACGDCDSCRLRLDGFAQCGVEDAIGYVDTADRGLRICNA